MTESVNQSGVTQAPNELNLITLSTTKPISRGEGYALVIAEMMSNVMSKGKEKAEASQKALDQAFIKNSIVAAIGNMQNYEQLESFLEQLSSSDSKLPSNIKDWVSGLLAQLQGGGSLQDLMMNLGPSLLGNSQETLLPTNLISPAEADKELYDLVESEAKNSAADAEKSVGYNSLVRDDTEHQARSYVTVMKTVTDTMSVKNEGESS